METEKRDRIHINRYERRKRNLQKQKDYEEYEDYESEFPGSEEEFWLENDPSYLHSHMWREEQGEE